jgi:EAL domain-containing protein (putative c-di-GMP-specific phosphodiesterase class I)
MQLQQLVKIFNDKCSQDQKTPNYHPFVLENGKVSVLFNKNRIDSVVTPVHYTATPLLTAGYITQTLSSPYTPQLHHAAIAKIIPSNAISLFDRLCRTTHLLNSLSFVNDKNAFLVLEISPRHIFALKQGHGVYFAEVIRQVGLQTSNIVVSMSLYGVYDAHHENLLLEGLKNYRALGYKIAINTGYLFSSNNLLDFVSRVSPNYLLVNAPTHGYSSTESRNSLLSELYYLKQTLARTGGKLIMREIEQKSQVLLAQDAGFELVEGKYYQSFDEFPAPSLAEYSKNTVKNYEFAG